MVCISKREVWKDVVYKVFTKFCSHRMMNQLHSKVTFSM